MTAIVVSSRCMPMSCSGSMRNCSRNCWRNGFPSSATIRNTRLSAAELKDIVAHYKDFLKEELGESFPQDPYEQLWGAISAVVSSWTSARATTFRALHAIPFEWGTAVNIQAMVFGNLGNDSATGVAFTPQSLDRGKRRFMVSSWSMPRARMWWRASAHRKA